MGSMQDKTIINQKDYKFSCFGNNDPKGKQTISNVPGKNKDNFRKI